MRKILFLLLTIFSIECSAQTISQKSIQALEHIQQGYVQYGVDEIKKLIAYNDLAAQYFLAVCYECGISMQQDNSKAFLYYRKAAERGLPDAMYHLASFYQNGVAVEKNDTRANEWLTRYKNKGGKLILPDVSAVLQEGLKHAENYAMNPNGGSMGGNALLAQNNNSQNSNNSNAAVNNITIIQQAPMQPKTASEEDKKEQSMPVKKSDVDENIPVNAQTNEKTFALIIANENYQDVATVPNALNDGVVFAEYCKKTLGLPESNVHLIKDATLNNIKREINLFKQITEAFKGEAKLIVYYAGHGVPDEKTLDAYILPIDGFLSDMTTCYSLNNLYDTFNHMEASQIVIFLDACFSGSLRGDGMLASARMAARKGQHHVTSSKMVVLSATQGDETAYSYKQQSHGLFTYYLLKKLQETKGDITLGDLSNYIIDNVSKKSLIENKKKQTPTVSSGMQTADWQKIALK